MFLITWHVALVVELLGVVHGGVEGGVDRLLHVDKRDPARHVEARDVRGRIEAGGPLFLALGANAVATGDRQERAVRIVRADVVEGPVGAGPLAVHVRCVGKGRHEPFIGDVRGQGTPEREADVVNIAVDDVRHVAVRLLENFLSWQRPVFLLLRVNVLRRLQPDLAHLDRLGGVHVNLL